MSVPTLCCCLACRAQIVYTQRVRPPPNPPQRALVSLLPKEGSASTHGRFTLLTYNLLADLYCKVGKGAQEQCHQGEAALCMHV